MIIKQNSFKLFNPSKLLFRQSYYSCVKTHNQYLINKFRIFITYLKSVKLFMKIFLILIIIFSQSMCFGQKLFCPDSVINNKRTENKLKKIISYRDKAYDIKIDTFWNGGISYSIENKDKNNWYAYSTETNTFHVDQFTHSANSNIAEAIVFYKKCGYLRYRIETENAKIIRFKNINNTVFVKIEQMSKNKVWIVISLHELSAESDS